MHRKIFQYNKNKYLLFNANLLVSTKTPPYLSAFLDTHFSLPIALNRKEIYLVLEMLFWSSFLHEDFAQIVHPDIAFFAPENEEWKVEEIREKIITRSSVMSQWPYQVIIIDKADNMNLASANAVLKLFEDTPKNTLFLLIIQSRNRLLPTIASRITVVSTEVNPGLTLSSEDVDLILWIIRSDHSAIGKFFLIRIVETDYAVAFLREFLKNIHWYPLSKEFYEIYQRAFETILSTNATVKYQLDLVILSYLRSQEK